MASFDARTQELIRTVVEKYDESLEVRPVSVLQQDIATVVAFAVRTYAGSSSTTQLNGKLGQGAEEMQKAVLRLEALSFARRHPRPTDRWTERLHLRMMQPRMRRRMLMIERARERAYASMDTEDRDVWVRERRERHAGVPTQVAVGDAVEEHGVRDYLSVIESPAMNSEKTGLLTAMLRLETRPFVLKFFKETARWHAEKGYFHGDPGDWNLVASALQCESLESEKTSKFWKKCEDLDKWREKKGEPILREHDGSTPASDGWLWREHDHPDEDIGTLRVVSPTGEQAYTMMCVCVCLCVYLCVCA